MKRLLLFAAIFSLLTFIPWHHALTGDGSTTAKKPGALPIDLLTKDQKTIEVKFPTNDANWETKWKIEWDMETIADAGKAGIKITDNRAADAPVLFKIKRAFFKPGRAAPWVQVLADAHPSELYVPYFFRHTRFFDLRDAGEYVPLEAKEGGPRGNTLGAGKFVMAEIRDRGVAYKNGSATRRAEELTLWANFNAGNYTYLIEYGFMDDGTIAFRHAPTGYNLPSDHAASHMHNCCWRIGIHLGLEDQKVVNTATVAKWPGDAPHEPDRGIIVCPLEVGPLPLSFRDDGDCMHYDGNYHQRPRVIGSDVDLCFAGNITISTLTVG